MMTLLGVYVGNDAEAVDEFESWLGSDVDLVHAVVGSASWTDFTSSASWMINTLWSGVDADLLWSVPLIVDDGSASLATAATGAYNDYYRSVAETLASSTDGDGPIYIRTGWEFNGDWFAWSAEGNEEAYIEAYRQFVDTFRSVSDRFVFEWCVDAASGGMDPSTAYPGDDYVDIIGMDFYWKTEYSGTDPVAAFEDMAYREYGLQWLEDFAAAHGKPTAYSEWGVSTDNAAEYIELVNEWFDSHDVVYQSYWDSDAAYEGKLSDGSNADSGAAYQELFAGSGETSDDTPASGTTADTTAVVADSTSDTAATTDTTTDTTTADAIVAASTTTDPATLAASADPSRWFYGTSATESWTGTSGNDGYKSVGGGDTMAGGLGDDTYVIYSASDTVVENTGAGTDTVQTWLSSYTLPDNVENLVITGTSWTAATGNALDNRITGNASPNTINGAGGADLLTGGGGADTFVIAVGEGGDTITDFSATEGDQLQLQGFGDGASLTHQGGLWTVTAADGETTSFTLSGVSSLADGTYSFTGSASVMAASTTASTAATADASTADATVAASTTTDPATLAASADPSRWFYGTSATESWTGTSGNDGYKSVGGGDTMAGGLGDDTYVIYSASDTVVENTGAGTDTVQTWLSSYTLPDNVENLVITGTSWTAATGNALDNRITGNASPNTINGAGGADLLTGGGGADTFVVAMGEGGDTITDFSATEGDQLQLQGFGDGASLTHQGGLWTVTAADGETTSFTLSGVSSLADGDYLFS
ncbi:glycosyl hydrolase [Roseomonas sp. E05]|uniref:glycosyl hydrolase n=1 Tax=Roseomonas sp. E05 TaxID=3046310 RepID=UPI0024BBDE20|nr:glycosyl hydrolase [Roseomonas sp. E05]MDJ0386536.1 glycosyl hydrolase [Roseomonas sp. E05]